MIDAKHYAVSVQYGVFDGEHCYEATVREFPEIREYADTFQDAYDLALDTIEIVYAQMQDSGAQPPTPIAHAPAFSGRITLRISKSLHCSLSAQADEEGVSLNQQVVNMLNFAQGISYASREIERRTSTILEKMRPIVVQSYNGQTKDDFYSYRNESQPKRNLHLQVVKS
jgi:predicted HicB family RNase H-like nuclease